MHRHQVEILCASIRVWYGRVVADESAARRLITCYDMTCHLHINMLYSTGGGLSLSVFFSY